MGIESMMRSEGYWKELFVGVVAFSFLVASILLLWRDNISLFVVVLAESLLVLAHWHDRFDISFFALITVLGSVAEVVFVHFGVWSYSNPTFLGLPLWFPPAFGTAALIGQRMSRPLAERQLSGS